MTINKCVIISLQLHLDCLQWHGKFVRILLSHDAEDVSLEQLAFRESSSLFEETYGIPCQLRAGQKE